MAVKIRLKRFGSKHKPCYRLVVAESANPRDGMTIEDIGQYDPKKEPTLFEFKKDRVEYWLSVGAQPTDTVRRLLGNEGILEKVTIVPKEPGLSRKEKKARQES